MSRKAILAALLAVFAPAAANAAVLCSLSASGVAFGPFAGTQITSTGQVFIHCVGGPTPVPYTVALSTGNSGTYTARQLRNGANILTYNLYQDPALTQIWGDGTGGSTILSGVLDFTGTVTFNHAVYGRIPTQTPPGAGAYSDTIIVTMTY